MKEQLKTLGVNDQIKSLVADKRLHPNPVKGKESGITQEQALQKLKVQPIGLKCCASCFTGCVAVP